MAKQPVLAPLRVGSPGPDGPAAIVTRRAAERLRDGSVWVYRSDIEQIQPALGGVDLEQSTLVTVLGPRGVALGSALFSPSSQISLRMVSIKPGLTRPEYLADLADRLQSALTLREQLAPTSPANNACRLVFSEADRLPGIVIDRYNDLIVVQLLTKATAQQDVRTVLTEVLPPRLPGLQTIVERPDPRVRIMEELDLAPGEPLFSANSDPPLKSVFTINGLHFAYDAASGQKTGAFLDQRLNYRAAAIYAQGRPSGRALDICTYQGGFALHLAQVCDRVTGVDASRAALEVADSNLERNAASIIARVDWIEADAFDLLREFEAAGERYSCIVLDPPAFAKSKRALEGAMRGYKELNLRALKMLEPGGILVTCSCSQHVSLADFQSMLASASADAKRRLQLLEVRGAAPDHPAIVTLPETNYLKCLIGRVE